MIRKALKKDSKQAARLMYDAILDIGQALTGESEKEEVIKKLEMFFLQEGNRLSYQNSLVETNEDDEAIGIVVAYHGKDAETLDRPILNYVRNKVGERAIIEKEADDTDFYIDTLSVDSAYRGHGIGTELIQSIFTVAKEKLYPTVSLVVEENNDAAKRLYERLGFSYKKTIRIHGHNYDYLIKEILLNKS